MKKIKMSKKSSKMRKSWNKKLLTASDRFAQAIDADGRGEGVVI